MHITVIEDRKDFAEAARKAGAHEVLCGDYKEMLGTIPGGDNYCFLTMSSLMPSLPMAVSLFW